MMSSAEVPHALQYPFDIPSHSYLWPSGECLDHLNEGLLNGRTPMLAVGSNAAPSQLERKFSRPGFCAIDPEDFTVPVLRANVPDVDVVYAARLASYGAVPATIITSPGATARVHVTWLTGAQLQRMNETEGAGRAYGICEIEGVHYQINLEGIGRLPARAFCYFSLSGAAILGKEEIGLAASPVSGSNRLRASQRDIWDRLAVVLGSQMTGEEFLTRVREVPETKKLVSRYLRMHARPPTFVDLSSSVSLR